MADTQTVEILDSRYDASIGGIVVRTSDHLATSAITGKQYLIDTYFENGALIGASGVAVLKSGQPGNRRLNVTGIPVPAEVRAALGR